MTTPKRIQRKRTKGWRMPEGAKYVGRPSAWGNPFVVGGGVKWFVNDDDPHDQRWLATPTPEAAVVNFRWLMSMPRHAAVVREHLAGLDLACWCPLDQPCHADVLLDIANAPDRRAREVASEGSAVA